jgi:hypothetical protein
MILEGRHCVFSTRTNSNIYIPLLVLFSLVDQPAIDRRRLRYPLGFLEIHDARIDGDDTNRSIRAYGCTPMPGASRSRRSLLSSREPLLPDARFPVDDSWSTPASAARARTHWRFLKMSEWRGTVCMSGSAGGVHMLQVAERWPGWHVRSSRAVRRRSALRPTTTGTRIESRELKRAQQRDARQVARMAAGIGFEQHRYGDVTDDDAGKQVTGRMRVVPRTTPHGGQRDPHEQLHREFLETHVEQQRQIQPQHRIRIVRAKGDERVGRDRVVETRARDDSGDATSAMPLVAVRTTYRSIRMP